MPKGVIQRYDNRIVDADSSELSVGAVSPGGAGLSLLYPDACIKPGNLDDDDDAAIMIFDATISHRYSHIFAIFIFNVYYHHRSTVSYWELGYHICIILDLLILISSTSS